MIWNVICRVSVTLKTWNRVFQCIFFPKVLGPIPILPPNPFARVHLAKGCPLPRGGATGKCYTTLETKTKRQPQLKPRGYNGTAEWNHRFADDEAASREEVLRLAAWCSENNLVLNTKKTSKLLTSGSTYPPFTSTVSVQRGSTPSGFSVPLSPLASPGQTTLQRATRRLRRESLGNTIWTPTRWPSTARAVFYGSCNMTVRKRQRSVAAFFLPWCTFTGTTACLSRAKNISSDSSHSSFKLFDLLPSGASEPKKTYDPKKSFFAKAITNLNSHMH